MANVTDYGVIAVHFGTIDAGTTGDGAPLETAQRIYIGSRHLGPSMALVLRDVIAAGERLKDDDIFTRLLVMAVITRDSAITISPTLAETSNPVLVVDCINEVVWTEDRDGEDLDDRTWPLVNFGKLDDDAARAAMEN